MALQVDVGEAGAKLPGLLERARAGEEVVIVEAGKRLVRLIPGDIISAERALTDRQLGTAKGLVFAGPDFDAPLPDEIIAEFEG
jgi:prevent-host-death family protein